MKTHPAPWEHTPSSPPARPERGRDSGPLARIRHGFERWLVLLALVLFAPGAALGGLPIVDGPNTPVRAVARGADGTTYLGGEFTRWGPQTGGGAALTQADGAVQRHFPSVAGGVITAVPDGVGGFYIGGSFTHVGGVPRNNLARIRATGEVDPNWNPKCE